MSGWSGKVVEVWFEDARYAPAQEVTFTVEHGNGSQTFLVVPVLRLSDPIPPEEKGLMPEHTPITEEELTLYEHAATTLDVAPAYRLIRALADLRETRRLLRAANIFIEYARHELKPGAAQFGDQFPRQDDADKILSEIGRYLAAAEGKGEEG